MGEATAVLLWFVYWGFVLTVLLRLNGRLPAEQKIRYGPALFFLPSVFSREVTEPYARQFPQGGALRIAHNLLVIAMCGLMAATFLTLMDWIIR
ncbi:MAG: hypothetical protein ACYDCM_16090 [Candidatus Acidiferrales bacterium]